MAYCAALLIKGIFKKVKVSFLVKGHTHECIDQMFSKLSQYLAYCDALTLDEMMKQAETCYRPKPTTELIQHQFNWDAYLKNPLYFRDFCHISKNRCFNFEKVDGKAQMKTRTFMTRGVWGDYIEILTGLPLAEHPLRQEPVHFTTGKVSQLSALLNAREKLFTHLGGEGVTLRSLSEQHRNFWDSEIEKQRAVCAGNYGVLGNPEHVWPKLLEASGKS